MRSPLKAGTLQCEMKKLLFTLLFLFTVSIAYSAPNLKGQFIKGSPGDYIITSQGGYYSLFLVRDLTDKHLILEEISVNTSNIDLKKIQWKNWVENSAPGASTWTSFVIDLEKNTLTQCYSYTEKQ